MGKYKQRDRIAQLVSWGHWFTFANIILCLLIGVFYLETALPAQTSIAAGYLMVSWLGHFAFLPFVFFIVLIFPLCLLVPYSRILRGYAAIIASIGIFALILDALFFRQYGFHLNTYSLTQLATDAEEWFAGGSFVMLLLLMLGFLVILGIELILANLTWKRHPQLQAKRIGKISAGVFIVAFIISHSSHIWADATLYSPITQQDDLFPASYPTTAKSLMTRHGWISVERFQSSHDRLTGSQQLAVRYPTSPLLCSKESVEHGVSVITFTTLSAESLARLNAEVPALTQHAQQHLGHRSVSDASYNLLFGVPDVYIESIRYQNLQPAYFNVLGDFAVTPSLFASEHFDSSELPYSLQSKVQAWQPSRLHGNNLQIIFAAESDIDSAITYLQNVPNNQRVIITGLVANSGPNNALVPQVEHLQVPLLSMNMVLVPRALSALEDIMPTALGSYMNCADDFRSFTNGINLQEHTREFPRVLSIKPYLYIFEANQTTVIDQNGEMQLFSVDGELMPGAVPPTPVFINSLRELQRFGG
ncbi:MAG: DUF3413 domain-containing protein [Idiomarina sp.]|nr:DUF3413 domain-containing protein [Idiomarina sp.]